MKNVENMLFDYLKDILFDPMNAHLDIFELPEDFRKLGEGMRFLEKCVREQHIFVRALSKGDLSVEPPSIENTIAGPIKELQSSLRHLAWQAHQISKGDYSQRVDFMGEFSYSFNTMTEQLRERTDALTNESRKLKQRNIELGRTLDMLFALTNDTRSMIFVFSSETDILFANQSAQWFIKRNPPASEVMTQRIREKLKGSDIPEFWSLELDMSSEEPDTSYFGVETFRIPWGDDTATACIISDDTERRRREKLMYDLAYIDPLTGLNNRRYAINLAQRWITECTPFLLAFIDIDYLKYCNDTYGHEIGDEYIIGTSEALKSAGGELCRIGGDEFMLLKADEELSSLINQLSELRNKMISSSGLYPQSFSFAAVNVPVQPKLPINHYMSVADDKMFEYKRKNKKKLRDLFYKDDRC